MSTINKHLYNKAITKKLTEELKANFEIEENRERYFSMLAFEELLSRLDKSQYWSKFIITGGFYFASIIQSVLRPTRDLDIRLIDQDLFNVEKIKNIFQHLFDMETKSDFVFKNINVKKKERTEIIKIQFIAQYGTRTKQLHIDLSKELEFLDLKIGIESINFKNIVGFNNQKLKNIQSYPLEKFIATKFLLIIKEDIECKRIKDYFDFIYLTTLLPYTINFGDFYNYVFDNTKTVLKKEEWRDNINLYIDLFKNKINKISKDLSVRKKWENLSVQLNLKYQNINISFDFIISFLNQIINDLYLKSKKKTKST